MKKIFNEQGFLNAKGEEATAKLKAEIIKLLEGNSIEEMQIIGSTLHKLVGDAVFDVAQAKRNIVKQFAEMSDEEFDKYLADKYTPTYGEKWLIKASLTEEEGARHMESFKRRIAKIDFGKFKPEPRRGIVPRGRGKYID